MPTKKTETIPENIILENFPWSDIYSESSFIGQLGGPESFNKMKYWELEYALVSLTPEFDYNNDLRWPIFRIFSLTMRKFASHYDSNDGFSIKKIKKEDLYDFRERIQMVFEGFFMGEMPDFDLAFEEQNPLLPKKVSH